MEHSEPLPVINTTLKTDEEYSQLLDSVTETL